MRDQQLVQQIRRLALLLVWLLCGLSACVSTPPFQEMSDARQAIALAAEAGAAEKSPRLFTQAQAQLRAAKEHMEQRRHSMARGDAIKARLKAIEALYEINLQSPHP